MRRRAPWRNLLATIGIGALLAAGVSTPPAAADDVVISSVDFDDGTSGDWQPTGGPNLEYVPDDDGGLALAVVGRSADYVGIETPAGMLDGLAAGDVVTFSMQVRLAEGTGDGAARFVLKPAYTWIGNTTVTASAWTAVTGSYTVAEGDEGSSHTSAPRTWTARTPTTSTTSR